MTDLAVRPVRISRPPITSGMSRVSAAIFSSRVLSSARSGEPGAYERFGSLTGCGTRRPPPKAASVIGLAGAEDGADAGAGEGAGGIIELGVAMICSREARTKRSFYSSCCGRLPNQLHDDLAHPGPRVELDQRDLLPRAEGQRAVDERDR